MLALTILLCVAVVGVFGMPLTLVLLPDSLRPWWPVALPFIGFATLVVVMQIPATIFSAGSAAWPVMGVMILATVVALACGLRLPRPSAWAVVIVLVGVVLGAFALRPSIHLRAPRPSGIVNNDAIYYLSVDQWIDHHGVRQAPPGPQSDGFYYPANQAYGLHLGVGADFADVVTARIGGTDPLNTLPVMTAIYVGLAGIAICLFVVALRGPPWLGAAAAVIAASRPDLLRIGLDSFVAQSAGLPLYIAGLAVLLILLRDGGWRPLGLAALLSAALMATYDEIAPAYVISGVVIGIVIVLTNRKQWRRPVLQLVAVAVIACVIDPLGAYDALKNLSSTAGLTGVAIVPLFGVIPDIGITVGPYSVVDAAGGVGLMVAVGATALSFASLLDTERLTRWLLVAALLGGVVLVLRESWLDPFSYGLYKALSLLSPFAAVGLVLGLRSSSLGLRVALGICLLALLGFNLQAMVQVSADGVNGVTGMSPGDRQLANYQKVVGPGNHSVALEGADRAQTPPAAEHFAVYWLRFLEHEHVTFAPNSLSYFRDPSLGPYQSDATYSPDYEDVASLGPSVTHAGVLAELGDWDIYRRAGNADLLMVGADWNPTSVGATFAYSDLGQGSFWLSAEHAARVRLSLRLAAPTAAPVAVTVRVNGHRLISRSVSQSPTTLQTPPLNVPAGRTIVELQSQVNGPGGSGVSVIQASVHQ